MPEQDDPRAVSLMVPSKDPEKEEDPTPKHSKGKLREPENDEPEIVRRCQRACRLVYKAVACWMLTCGI